MAQIPRLYIDQDLAQGQTLTLSREAANYIFAVMRLMAGAPLEIFNGRDGTFAAEVVNGNKRGGLLLCLDRIAPQMMSPDLWLFFAPVKKSQTDFIVQKAVELGASRLCPVQSHFTNSERARTDKMRVQVLEAAEQCGINYVPDVSEYEKLSRVLDTWPQDRRLLFCDERARGAPMSELTPDMAGAWGVLVGPEGGFSDGERAQLRGLPFATSTSLGPRILRAETAAVAALSLWQIHLGDWT